MLQNYEDKQGGKKMAYRINEEDCISCGACQPVCPVECIAPVE